MERKVSIGALIIVAGGLLVLLRAGEVLTVEIDRKSGDLIVRKTSILGRSVRHLAVDSIVDVRLYGKRSHGTGRASGWGYGIKLVLEDGEELSLFGTSSGRIPKIRMIAELRDAIGLKQAVSGPAKPTTVGEPPPPPPPPPSA
jgi:hypothetical protein